MLSKEEIEFNLKALSGVMLNFEVRLCDEMQERDKEVKEYIDKLESDKQKLIEKLKERIRYFEENDELIATSNDNYSDGTVIKRFIDEFKEILEILK